MAGKKRSSTTDKNEAQRAEQLFNDLLKCEPVITEGFLEQAEASFAPASPFSAGRRLALVAATKGGDWYREVSEDRSKAVAAAYCVRVINDQAKGLRQLAEVFERASMRTQLALWAHKDFDQIEEESKALGG